MKNNSNWDCTLADLFWYDSFFPDDRKHPSFHHAGVAQNTGPLDGATRWPAQPAVGAVGRL